MIVAAAVSSSSTRDNYAAWRSAHWKVTPKRRDWGTLAYFDFSAPAILEFAEMAFERHARHLENQSLNEMQRGRGVGNASQSRGQTPRGAGQDDARR